MAAVDTHEAYQGSPSGPWNNWAAVTPNDGADLAYASCVIMVTGAGNIKVDTLGGQTAVTLAVAAGFEYKIRATRIYNTDTTATGIIVGW